MRRGGKREWEVGRGGGGRLRQPCTSVLLMSLPPKHRAGNKRRTPSNPKKRDNPITKRPRTAGERLHAVLPLAGRPYCRFTRMPPTYNPIYPS